MQTNASIEARKKSSYERIMERVYWDGDCLIWPGAHVREYGVIRNLETGKNEMTHRVVYEAEVGPIPPGLTIDHLRPPCSSKRCCNVKHMEVVTRGENARRGSFFNPHIQSQRESPCCVAGHPWSDENTAYTKKGHRRCLACAKRRNRERVKREQAKRLNRQVAERDSGGPAVLEGQ